MDVLDNPVWHALRETQRGHAEGGSEGGAEALRLQPDIGPWLALPDDPTSESWAALAELLGPGGTGLLIRPEGVEVASGWEKPFAGVAVQMVATASSHEPQLEFEVLEEADVPEMLELVASTQPGPFAVRTIALGTYLGIRRNGHLVAMAGERMQPPGFVEVSAVCTSAEHRGRGLAGALVSALVARVTAGGGAAILHVAKENTGAIRLYETLGFTARRQLTVLGVRAPE